MAVPPTTTLERPVALTAAPIDPRIRARRIEVQRGAGRRRLQRLVDVGLVLLAVSGRVRRSPSVAAPRRRRGGGDRCRAHGTRRGPRARRASPGVSSSWTWTCGRRGSGWPSCRGSARCGCIGASMARWRIAPHRAGPGGRGRRGGRSGPGRRRRAGAGGRSAGQGPARSAGRAVRIARRPDGTCPPSAADALALAVRLAGGEPLAGARAVGRQRAARRPPSSDGTEVRFGDATRLEAKVRSLRHGARPGRPDLR